MSTQPTSAQLDRLEQLGRAIAGAQDRLLAEQRPLEEQRPREPTDNRPRLRLETASRRASALTRRPVRPALAVAAGVALGLAAALVLFLLAAPLLERAGAPGFSVGPERRPGRVGRFIQAPPAGELALRFSDGSTVQLRPRAGLRVQRLHRSEVRVLLERGGARVQVQPRARRRWRVDLGPFKVRVTGTRFDVSWDPAREVFALALERGKVVVDGPVVQRRDLRAGQTMRVWVAQRRMELGDRRGDERLAARRDERSSQAPGTRAASEPRAGGTGGMKPAARPPSRSRSPSPSPSRPRPWELARSGRYAAALTAAEREGWEELLERAGAEQLMALGDAARLRRDRRGPRIFRVVRSRFAGTRVAAEAAFYLGRIDFDQRRDLASAAGWFEIYLRERPRGRLATMAAGRRLEALHRSGDAAGAARAARLYLQRYPGGPHAAFARSLGGGR